MKMLTIFDIANFLLRIVDRDSGSTITPLKLQKILYYSQGFYLALNKTPLFQEDFEAWAHGPANPGIYEKYKEYGYNAIGAPEEELKQDAFNDELVDFLFKIWNTFGIYDGKYLEELTHTEEPWLNARKGCKPGEFCNNIITKESMREFFTKKINVN